MQLCAEIVALTLMQRVVSWLQANLWRLLRAQSLDEFFATSVYLISKRTF